MKINTTYNFNDIKKMCKMCSSCIPHLHFYVIEKNEFKTFEECLEHTRKVMTEYHLSFGKDGFLSERTTDDYISDENILKEAKKKFEIKLVIEQTVVSDKFDEKKISLKENFKGWITTGVK